MLCAALALQPNQLATRIATLSPDHATLIATLGICLVFFELNRPGRILPGSLGLALFLFATGAIAHHQVRPSALVLLLVATALLATNLWKKLPLWLLAGATGALAFALRTLLPGPSQAQISLPVALTSGLTVGLLGTALSRIAFRARRLKAVH